MHDSAKLSEQMHKTYHNIILALIVLVATIIGGSCLSQTASAATDSVNLKKGLTLSPLRSELNIAPGTSLDGTLVVTNSTDNPIAVNLSVEAFGVVNQQYDYSFNNKADFTKWVTFSPQETTLKPGESKKAIFNIGVPLTAEPGGRYISLFASTDTKAGDSGVLSRQRIASLIYLTVTGNVSRIGELVSLAAPWATSGDSTWSATIRNSGTTHFRSSYSVRLQDLLGNDVSEQARGDALILPATVRAISDTLPLPQFPGVYKAVYSIGLGDTPGKIETRYVLYLPLSATLVIFSIAVLLVTYVFHRRSRKSK